MSYRGRELTSGNYLKLDDIQSQFNGSTTTFNLTSGGSAFYPGSAFSLLVSLAGVVQEAVSAYTINQNTITFASAPQASDDFFCIVLGIALGVGVPGDGTVSGEKLTEPFDYDDGLLYLDSVNDRVGINSTAPRAALDVRGGIIVSGGIDASGIITARTGITVSAGGINAVGVITATSFSGAGSGLTGVSTNFVSAIGIQSAGLALGVGITQLNFIGLGNTFSVNGTTIDISIAGGSAGAGGTFSASAVGVHTTKILGINTTTIAGAANSEGALQVVGNVALIDGALLTDQDVNSTVFIPAGKNGLLIGPVTVGIGATVDIASGSTLVIV
jgi:hypothetical protein